MSFYSNYYLPRNCYLGNVMSYKETKFLLNCIIIKSITMSFFILSLINGHCFTLNTFANVYLERFMKRTLTYFKLQVFKQVLSLKEVKIY